MALKSTDEIVAEIRALPLAERLKVIERVAHEVAEATPVPPADRTAAVPSLIGLMADEPDLVDEVCAIAYEARAKVQPRVIDG